MATWDRYGEEKKYTQQFDTNVNPKHVGETLRTLTLEDRLELRRIARENEKRRHKNPDAPETVLEDDGTDDDEVDTAAARPAKAAKTGVDEKVNRTVSKEAVDKPIEDLVDDDDIVVDMNVNNGTNGKQVVALDAEEGGLQRTKSVGNASERGLKRTKSVGNASVARTESAASPVEDLEADDDDTTAKPIDASDKNVVTLDDADAVPTAAAARRARRKANVAKAKAAPAPAKGGGVQVLE